MSFGMLVATGPCATIGLLNEALSTRFLVSDTAYGVIVEDGPLHCYVERAVRGALTDWPRHVRRHLHSLCRRRRLWALDANCRQLCLRVGAFIAAKCDGVLVTDDDELLREDALRALVVASACYGQDLAS